VAYRLQLPENSLVHPVVHVSQLHLAAGFKGSVSAQLPSSDSQYQVRQQVLASHMVTRGATQVAQVKVSWIELPNDLATCEDYTVLKQAFPRAPACWGQAGFQEPGNVSSTVEKYSKEKTGPSNEAHRQLNQPRKRNVQIAGPEWVEARVCVI
jgi:hypothetical protein